VNDQEWIREFLSKRALTWELGSPMTYDKYGQDYETLLLGGVRDENRAPPVDDAFLYSATREDARKRYEETLMKFLGGRRHIIWRIEPEIVQVSENALRGVGMYMLYSRLSAYSTASIP
jgi:hypothetical protein